MDLGVPLGSRTIVEGIGNLQKMFGRIFRLARAGTLEGLCRQGLAGIHERQPGSRSGKALPKPVEESS